MAGARAVLYDETFTTPDDDPLAMLTLDAPIVENGTGQITITVPNDTLDAFPADGMIVALDVEPDPTNHAGTFERLAAFRVERPLQVAIDQAERASEVTTIAGRGLARDLAEATVQPPGIKGVDGSYLPAVDTRDYDWKTPIFDRSGWAAGVNRGLVSDRVHSPEQRKGVPYNFANPLTSLLAATAASGTPDSHDPWYGHLTYSTGSEGRWTPYMAAPQFQLAIDGVMVLDMSDESIDGMEGTTLRPLLIPTGTHSIDMKVWTPDRAWFPRPSVAALAISDFFGPAESWLVQTALIDFAWTVLGPTTSPPAFNPGTVVSHLFAASQADGELVGWSCSFDGSTDSAGNPWPETGQWSFQVGSSLLDALGQLVDQGYIDWAVRADALILDMWPQGSRGSDKSATYQVVPASEEYAEGWLTKLSNEVDYSTVVTRLRVRDDLGWFDVGTGHRTQKLMLGGIKDRVQSTQIATDTLARLAEPQRNIVVGIDPPEPDDVPRPSTWWIGDSVLVPDETDTPRLQRNVGQRLRYDGDRLVFEEEFGDLKLGKLARLARQQKRMIDGAIGGLSGSAALATKMQPAQVQATDWSEDWSWNGQADAISSSSTDGPSVTLTQTTRIQRVELQSKDITSSGTTTITAYLDGVWLDTISLVGAQTSFYLPLNTVGASGSVITVVMISRGTHDTGRFTIYGSVMPTTAGYT